MAGRAQKSRRWPRYVRKEKIERRNKRHRCSRARACLEEHGAAGEDGGTDGCEWEDAVELDGLVAAVGVKGDLSLSGCVDGCGDGRLVRLLDLGEWDGERWVELDDRLCEVVCDRLDGLSLLLSGVSANEVGLQGRGGEKWLAWGSEKRCHLLRVAAARTWSLVES